MRRPPLSVQRSRNPALTIATISTLISLLVVVGFVIFVFRRETLNDARGIPDLKIVTPDEVSDRDLVIGASGNSVVIETRGGADIPLTPENIEAWLLQHRVSDGSAVRIVIRMGPETTAGDLYARIETLQEMGFTSFAFVRDP